MLKLARQPFVGREPVTFQETPACILPVRKGQRWKAPAKNTLNEGGFALLYRTRWQFGSLNDLRNSNHRSHASAWERKLGRFASHETNRINRKRCDGFSRVKVEKTRSV